MGVVVGQALGSLPAAAAAICSRPQHSFPGETAHARGQAPLAARSWEGRWTWLWAHGVVTLPESLRLGSLSLLVCEEGTRRPSGAAEGVE